jgi:drug/metabolite transporter (DMT)-like permease
MVGLTTLPPTIYVITANSEIIFEAMLTRLYLKRSVSRLQVLSVLCVIIGVAVSLYTTPSMRQGGTADNGLNKTLVMGVSVTVLSRLASAFNTVLADK